MHDQDKSGAAQEFGSQMLEAALQTAVGAVIIIDDGGLIRTVNPSTQKLFGYSESELIGQNVSLLMPEPFRSRHDGYIRHHLETGERKIIGIGRQVMGRRKSGAIFPMHLSVSTFTADGRRFFTGIVHDLSDQRGAGALREQALFEAIFNHLPDSVLVVDADHKILLCNPTVARVFGYAPEVIIGQGTDVLYETPSEYESFRKMEMRLREREMPEPVVVRYRRASGEAFPAETVASVLRDADGRFTGHIKLIRDISKQVVQDEALRKSQRMEAIGQLTGGIAHDFNNLLTIITGNHELLEMELECAEQRDLLSRANNAAMMGARLTNRLLTFARRRRLDPVVLDLNEQVLVMAELLRRTLGEAIALGTLLAPRLWSVQTDPNAVPTKGPKTATSWDDAPPSSGTREVAPVLVLTQAVSPRIARAPPVDSATTSATRFVAGSIRTRRGGSPGSLRAGIATAYTAPSWAVIDTTTSSGTIVATTVPVTGSIRAIPPPFDSLCAQAEQSARITSSG
jgi:PAS domain S-box-containing protein